MAVSKKQRAQITELILSTMKALDPSGANSERYKKALGDMSDEQFSKYATRLAKDPDFHFYLEAIPFKNEPKLEDIERAAKIVGVPLSEHVYFRHDSGTPVRSREKVPVGLTA